VAVANTLQLKAAQCRTNPYAL